MKPKVVVTIFRLLLPGMSFLASSQTRTSTATIKLVIAPALEVSTSGSRFDFDLDLGTTATAATELYVGTNDWPLDLSISMLSAKAGSDVSFEYRLETIPESLPLPSWSKIPDFELASPIELASPGWTRYRLFVRVAVPENACPGTFQQVLRLIFHSSSSLVEIRDIPIHVNILSRISEGQGRANATSTGQSAVPNADKIVSRQVLVITWEGVSLVRWENLPAAD